MEKKEKNNKMNKEIILSKKIWTIDKYNFFEYMSVMLDWWVWISESLNSVSSKITSPYFRQKIIELETYISSWDSFSKAMKKMPSVFEDSEVAIIESWEAVGQLSQSFMKLSDDLKKIHELKNKIKSALTYPLVIFVFLILALIIVLVYVIPAMIPLFADAGMELPFATRSLISVSDFVIWNIWLILLIVISIWVAVVWYYNTQKWRENLELFVFNFPWIWTIYKNYILANIASSLSTLVGSWIWIIKALKLTWKSTNSIVYENIFDDLIERVSKWEWIVKSIEEIDKEHDFFPADYTQMLYVWEKTANIESISKKISIQYEKEVDYSLARLTKWIEPIAILIAWVFVCWFAFAIFGGIQQMTDIYSQ